MSAATAVQAVTTRSNSGSVSPTAADAPFTAAFLLLPGFTLLALSGFIEVLRHAADRSDRGHQIHCKWTILGSDTAPVRSSCGVTVPPWEALRPIPDYKYLVVVGGLTSTHAKVDRKTLDFIRRAYEAGTIIVGLCTATFILAQAGILDSSRCCVHHFHIEEFREKFPRIDAIADRLFLDGRRVITCAGGCGTVDLALHLVGRHFGPTVSAKVAGHMSYGQWRSHDHPQPPIEGDLETDVRDPLVRRALYVLRADLGQALSVGTLARRIGVAPRSLARHFVAELGMSPARYIRRARVDFADWLLANTERSISEVALDCGFCDVAHFTRSYRSVRGSTPSAFRRRALTHGAAATPGKATALGLVQAGRAL
jgi:transcriptional regulator GlxA family with amidase domain